MRHLCILVAASLLAAERANAGEWYLTARAGAGEATIFNSHFDSNSIGPKPTFTRLTDEDDSSVSFASIAIGRSLSVLSLRAEAEMSHWGGIDWREGYSLFMPGIAGQFTMKQSVSAMICTLNIYYDQPVSGSFIAFAGVGTGAARVETRSQRGFAASKTFDVQPVATFSLGGMYSLSERWGLEIRGTTTTSLDLDFEPQTRGWTHNKADISLSAVSIGARRYF